MESLASLLALVLTAVALMPAAAHVLELPNKLPLAREAYLTVQQVYRGWSRIGFVVVAATIATLWLAVVSDESSEVPATIAFLAILMTQVVFWLYTFPVNRRTHNWTEAPENWEELRDRWEISHAASALLNFIAFVCVAVAILRS
jgi:hypothetical protein